MGRSTHGHNLRAGARGGKESLAAPNAQRIGPSVGQNRSCRQAQPGDLRTLQSPDGSSRLLRVMHLTKQEQLVLCAVIGLLLVGWVVKTWRTAHPPPPAVEQVKD